MGWAEYMAWKRQRRIAQRDQAIRSGQFARERGLIDPSTPMPDPWSQFAFPDGEDPHVPPPGWEQQPHRPVTQHMFAHATVRWGDTIPVEIERLAAANNQKATGYVTDTQLQAPATCLIRLSATTPELVATDPLWFVDWSLQIGVGSSNQTKLRRILIGPQETATVDTDILLTWPLQLLRVQGTVNIGPGVVATIPVHLTVHVAPFTYEGGMVR